MAKNHGGDEPYYLRRLQRLAESGFDLTPTSTSEQASRPSPEPSDETGMPPFTNNILFPSATPSATLEEIVTHETTKKRSIIGKIAGGVVKTVGYALGYATMLPVLAKFPGIRRSKVAKTAAWLVETPIKLGTLGTLGALAALSYEAHHYPSDHLRHLENAYASHVVYANGKQGIFFPNFTGEDLVSHPVKIRELPLHIIQAFCALEDDEFYGAVAADLSGKSNARSHVPLYYVDGLDFKGFARAAIHDTGVVYERLRDRRAGNLQGGSSVPMQTAEIYTERLTMHGGNPEELLKGKWREARNTLMLWKMYSPAQIMEFYLNKLPVRGSAVGLEELSRSMFDKPAKELAPYEALAIASTIRNPNSTTPFKKASEPDNAARDKRRAELKNRIEQGVGMMRDHEWLSPTEHNRLLTEFREKYANPDTFFTQGRHELVRDHVVEFIVDEMKSEGIASILQQQGITPEQYGTAGLEIHVTVDKRLEDIAKWAVRHHAGEISTRLTGFSDAQREEPDTVTEPRQYGFYYGRITDLVLKTDAKWRIQEAESYAEVTFGDGSRLRGQIPYARLQHIANLERKEQPADVQAYVLSHFHHGKIVLTSVRSFSNSSASEAHPNPSTIQEAILDIENSSPTINACVDVQRHDGGIAAFIGSVNNLGFNYCGPGKNNQGMQPGSAFKTILWDLALDYGWNIASEAFRLPNNVRPFIVDIALDGSYKLHAPLNDHGRYAEVVNPYQAFADSENIAHFALQYRLFDFLTPEQYRTLVAQTPLGMQEGENEQAYFHRLAQRERDGGFGIYYNQSSVPIAAFDMAVHELLPAEREKAKLHQENDLDGLLLLWYGYEEGIEEVQRKLKLSQRLSSGNEEIRAVAERDTRLSNFNYLRLIEFNAATRQKLDYLRAHVDDIVSGNVMVELELPLQNMYLQENTLLVMEDGWPVPPDAKPVTIDSLFEFATVNSVIDPQKLATLFQPNKVKLDGLISSASIDYVQNKVITFTLDDLRAQPEEHPMFRLRAALSLLRDHAKTLGMTSTQLPLEPTIILGAGNVVPQDFTRATRTMLTGTNCRPYIISKIVYHDKVIYEAKPFCEVISRDTAHQATMLELMHGPIAHGTAAFMSKGEPPAVSVATNHEGENIAIVPYMVGKTGTTSGYTDAWLIYAMSDVNRAHEATHNTVASVDPEHMLFMTGWIGDYNKKRDTMSNRGFKVYGAEVAPILAAISNEALKDDAAYLNLAEIVQNKNFILVNEPTMLPQGYTKMPVWVYNDVGTIVYTGECAIESHHPALHCAMPDGTQRDISGLVLYKRSSYGPGIVNTVPVPMSALPPAMGMPIQQTQESQTQNQ